jgi:hypothetical protein
LTSECCKKYIIHFVGGKDKMKSYYSYSQESLNKEYDEPIESPSGIDDYLIFLETFSYRDQYGGQSKGILRYDNKLHALKHLESVYQEFAENCVDEEECELMLQEIEERIEKIEKNMTDVDICISDIGFHTYSSGFIIWVEGYWDKAVPEILCLIAADEIYRDYIADSVPDDEICDKFKEEFKDILNKFKEESYEIQIEHFLYDKDIQSEEFIDFFISLCDDYDSVVN